MQRRSFLKNSIAACTSTLFLDSIMNKAFAQSSVIDALNASTNDKVLVLVQLNGGNDGINTVIPLDQYTNLSSARANVLIKDTDVLKLNGNSTTGLHPAMGGMKDLYDNKSLSLIQGVSYPNPDFSHFRATDIWLTGADSDKFETSGVGGRYLQTQYPGFPTGYPNALNPDPLAIQIGSSVSLFLQGAGPSMGMSIASLAAINNLINGTTDPVPSTPAGHELAFLRLVNQQTQKYNTVIATAASAAPVNISTKYPVAPDNRLGDQLKIVARLIKGGLKTKIYIVSVNGFDTHAAQVDPANHSIGAHANLLSYVSKGIEGFQDDCIKMGIDNRVTGMVFSEFGRRIISNGSGGTDHGSGAPVIMFGTELIGGMYGKNPTISANVSSSFNVPMQFDFRQIYATIMKDWFAIDDAAMSSTMLKSYTTLDLFKKKQTNISDQMAANNSYQLGEIYPNPIQSSAVIPFSSKGGYVSLKLHDLSGRTIATLIDNKVDAGAHQIVFERNNIPAGNYILEMQGENYKNTSMLVLE